MSHCLGGDARTMRYLKGLDGLWYALTFDTASHIVIKNQREGDNYAIILQKKRGKHKVTMLQVMMTPEIVTETYFKNPPKSCEIN